MERIRFYRLQLSRSDLAALRTGMEQERLRDRSMSGFILDGVDRSAVTGRFVQRTRWRQEVEDPQRGSLTVSRIAIEITRFRLSSEAPGLEMYDPARRVNLLITSISR